MKARAGRDCFRLYVYLLLLLVLLLNGLPWLCHGAGGRRHHASAAHHLEQKLVDFDVPAGLGEIAAPGVEPVPREQEAVAGRAGGRPIECGEPMADSLGELRHVLRVGEDRKSVV